MNYTITPARDSGLAVFDQKIVLLDQALIGTSERIRHEDSLNEIEASIRERGYDGPVITVFEQHRDDLYNQINGRETLSHITFGQLGVADGHHRLEAIRRLALRHQLPNMLIPCQLIPAHDPDCIKLATLHDNETPLELTAIEDCFMNPDAIIPPASTTHFQARLKDGRWVRLANATPNLRISIAELLI